MFNPMGLSLASPLCRAGTRREEGEGPSWQEACTGHYTGQEEQPRPLTAGVMVGRSFWSHSLGQQFNREQD